MHSREDFIRQICETPSDDHLRLVFADWLDENEPESSWSCWIRSGLGLDPVGASLDTAMRATGGWNPHRYGVTNYQISGGFVSKVLMSSSSFMEHHEGVFRTQPITEVILTDKRDGYGRFLYDENDVREAPTEENLPSPIFAVIRDWVKEGHFPAYYGEGAHDTGWPYIECSGTTERHLLVSNGCVEYGRRRVGLGSLYVDGLFGGG